MLWEASLHQSKPPPILLFPALHVLLREGGREGGVGGGSEEEGGRQGGREGGVEGVVALLLGTFWRQLLVCGYYPSEELKAALSPALAAFVASSLGGGGKRSLPPFFPPSLPLSLLSYRPDRLP